MTAEELLRLNLPNKRTELVRGVLVVREPAGYQHGDVAMRLAAAIFTHVLGGEDVLPGFEYPLSAMT
jgi:hypothetical protein